VNSEEYYDLWKQEGEKPFSGWDFSYLDGRMLEEPLPWSYTSRAIELMRYYSSMIDMGTGGGELLLQLKAHWPKKVTATEEYPPNFELATNRLKPMGVQVIDVKLSEESSMPFVDNEYELILNRHSGFNPREVGRVLSPDGIFLTQQVHGLSTYDLISFFESKPPWPNATPEYYVPRLKAAGLTIKDLREWSGKMSFTDVGALVYYLKSIPWVVLGFTVETHFKFLLSLQRQLENGQTLTFTVKRYLIEAHKECTKKYH
jgi:SAM-dependent methyltransferase